ncbi:hypothetical protein EDD11_000123 [Mortierella claussenii]|nr:hypothetical protein EDD11_000123 [Mortierella claussenii]
MPDLAHSSTHPTDSLLMPSNSNSHIDSHNHTSTSIPAASALALTSSSSSSLSTSPSSTKPSLTSLLDLGMTPITNDPFTSNIIHDTDDRALVQTMVMVAEAGADAGAAAASVRSSTSSLHSDPHLCSSSSASSTSSSSSTSATAIYAPSSAMAAGSRPPTAFNRSSINRPSIEIPQPQSPISLHHALDSTLPATPLTKPSPAPRILPRAIESCVQDTLAKDSQPSLPYQGPGSNGHRRIMTPTSRLAETAVGVREVSKKIGRARVKWETPKTVIIVTKPGDESLLKITRDVAFWMIKERGLTVFVEDKMKDLPKFKYPSFLKSTKLGYDYTQSLKFWTSDLCAQEAHLFDMAITLGGDGTVLFTSWLFQRIVPPILPFSAGSLGFLTPFPTVDHRQILSTCLDHGVRVNLRMRFSCTIYRCLEHRTVDTTKKKKRKGNRNRNRSKNGSQSGKNTRFEEDDSDDDSDARRQALPTVLTTPTETFEILNDLVLDRGPSANLSLLELFGDEEHLTTVQADGIVISTPTGSTAYSLAAGGPLTHPEIPAILISPICPHTLSFRPMLLPDSMELRICVPFDSRSTAWASFDGRGRVELKQGDHIKVTASVYPFPTICSSTQSSDWFHSLSRCLRWNERERQKGFRVVEHSRPRRARQSSAALLSPSATSSPPATGGKTSGGSGAINGPGTGSGAGGVSSSQNSPHGLHHQDHSSGFSPSMSHQNHASHHSHGHGHTHSPGSSHGHGHNTYHHYQQVSGNSSSSSSTRTSRPSHRSGVVSPTARKTPSISSSTAQRQEYFDQSPHDTDTMLTCWGTDSSGSDDDEDDEEGEDESGEKEDEAADGDGEWEEGSSSEEEEDDDDDDDNHGGRRVLAAGGHSRMVNDADHILHEGSSGSGSGGERNGPPAGIIAPRAIIPNSGGGHHKKASLCAVEALASKLEEASVELSADADSGSGSGGGGGGGGGASKISQVANYEHYDPPSAGRPTVVPRYLQDRYATTFYGSGDLQQECLSLYHECASRLEALLSLNNKEHAYKQNGGSVVIMSGEGMVALWGGLKSVVPWPFQYNEEGHLVGEANTGGQKYKVLCVGNGVYGDGMQDMVKGLRYPNVEVEAVNSPWDRPVDVESAIRKIGHWKPDLVTMVHCDTPTGALNSEAVKAVGEACSKTDALFYVDVVSSAGAVPVDITGWNIDIGLLGSQKALSCEPSLAMVTVSGKAWKQIEKVAYSGYDALLPFKNMTSEFPYTPLWSALDAMNVQLKTIYGDNNEKVQQVYDRHTQVAQYCRERVQKMGLRLWWEEREYASLSSASVTAIRVPENTTWEMLDQKLRKEGVVFGGSYGQTANALFRIGHMGSQADLITVKYALDVLERIVGQQ